MAHIHTEAGQYDQTVSLYIVNTAGDEPRLLLHQHRILNIFMQPGGHVELNEDHWAAAKHELLEETGYELSQLSLLQPRPQIRDRNSRILPQPLMARAHEFWVLPGHYHEDLVYGLITDQQPLHAVADGESDSLRWVTLRELQTSSPEEIIADAVPIGEALLTRWQEWDIVPTTDFD
jgi:8-oxo-dGTP pyrophosphatase MutT (NUDIX family)